MEIFRTLAFFSLFCPSSRHTRLETEPSVFLTRPVSLVCTDRGSWYGLAKVKKTIAVTYCPSVSVMVYYAFLCLV